MLRRVAGSHRQTLWRSLVAPSAQDISGLGRQHAFQRPFTALQSHAAIFNATTSSSLLGSKRFKSQTASQTFIEVEAFEEEEDEYGQPKTSTNSRWSISKADQEEEYLDMFVGDSDHDVKSARYLHKELQRTDGYGLSVALASAVIESLALRGYVKEGLDMLRFSREKGVRPRIHAYSSVIGSCYSNQEYVSALKVFEVMRNDRYVPKLVTYSHAMTSALKSRKHALVLEIFDDLLRNRLDPTIIIYNNVLNSCARNADVHTAQGILETIRERGIEMSQSTYHSIVICAGKTGRVDLAFDMLRSSEKVGFKPTMTMYNSVLAACAKGKRWKHVVNVFEEMPEQMQYDIHGQYLGAVIMGYSKAEDEKDKRKAVSLFFEHKRRDATMNFFSHNALLMAYLNLGELESVHQFANEMKKKGLEWDTLTYQTVTLAYIRGGAVDTAEQMLHKNAKHMNTSTWPYRELIRHHAEVRQDMKKACTLTMQMMYVNPRLSRLDWHNALGHALKLNDLAIYWNFRKWMQIRAPLIEDEVPKELMLPKTHPSYMRHGKNSSHKSKKSNRKSH